MLASRRLTLTPVGPGDAAAIIALHREPRVSAQLVDGIPDTPAVADLFLRWNAGLAARGLGTFAARRHGEPALIGLFSLTPYDGDEALLELGGKLLPKAWAGGLGVEAGALLIDHAFGPLGRTELVSAFHPDNRAARASLVRLGFADDGEHALYGRTVARMRLDRAAWRGSPDPPRARAGRIGS